MTVHAPSSSQRRRVSQVRFVASSPMETCPHRPIRPSGAMRRSRVGARWSSYDRRHDALRDALIRAQRATSADVVTCGLRLPDGRLRLFAGDAAGLGALSNEYGTVALVRRDLLDRLPAPWPEERDSTWPLLASLAASGASIVSIPLALADGRAAPGSVEDDPAAALRAVQQLERALPEALRGAARLAAGLAADARRGGVSDGGLPKRARRAFRSLL